MRRARSAIPFALAGAAAIGAALLGACSGGPALPSVPAPWEAAENPAAEPASYAPIPNPDQWERVGSSVRGKGIEARNVGSGPRRVYVIGGYYGDQAEGPAVAAALPALLDGLAGSEKCTVRILRDMNPDGSATRTKNNTRGIDLNRNWPAPDFRKDKATARAGSELEVAVVQKDLLAFKPDLVVVLTSSVRGPVVAFDGGSRTLSYDFASAARAHDGRFRVVPDRWAATPGSVESYIVMSMRRPVLSVELPRACDPNTAGRAIASGILASGAAAPAGAPRPTKTAGR